jgi:hypothetical protein
LVYITRAGEGHCAVSHGAALAFKACGFYEFHEG